MNPGTQRLRRWLAAIAIVCALLVVLGIGAFTLAIGRLPEYQQRIAERVRDETGLRLEFDSVVGRWSRHGPEVVFRGARVLPESSDEPLLTADSGRVSLSIPRTIWYRRLELGRVHFVRPRLGFVITSDGSIQLVGQSALERAEAAESDFSLDRMPRGRIAVSDATLEVLDLRARQGRFEITGANVDIERSGDEITLSGRLALPEHLGSRIDFEGKASGELGDMKSVDWRVRADGRDLNLEGWAAMLPDSFAMMPAAGHGSIRVSMRGSGRELANMRLQPDFDRLMLQGSTEVFTRVAGDIRFRRTADTLAVQATGLELSRKGLPWRPTRLEASVERRDKRFVSASARADYLRIENLAVLGALLPQGTLRDRLATLAPRGEIFGLDVGVVDRGAKRVPDVTGRLRFVNLGYRPYRMAPVRRRRADLARRRLRRQRPRHGAR
jgi:uncharacterized protein YhdP